MKSKGFTLAEILVTLGIIGVISALTLPTFTQGSNMAKVGPLLGKAKSQFEQATIALMQEKQVDSLLAVYGNSSNSSFDKDSFMADLIHFLKGSQKNSEITSADGVYYIISDNTAISGSKYPYENVCSTKMMVDINGKIQGPNKDSKDIFYFELRDDGSLVPWGSNAIPEARRNDQGGLWTDNCPKNLLPTKPIACAGHIFENGLKAEYK